MEIRDTHDAQDTAATLASLRSTLDRLKEYL